MRPILDMDTVQIEITNACNRDCSNCTRFCGHVTHPFMMDETTFRNAVDSMVGYPKMTGIMGGEPLLHPQFEEFCRYAVSKIPRAQLGLWTGFPQGYERYAQTICDTFGNIFLNDHTRNDIYHAPILIGIQEIVPDRRMMWPIIDKCWVQNSWSASINPNGAYFCEVAAAMGMLFNEPEDAWPVDEKWWARIPKDYAAQAERFCPRCGLATPLRRRPSIDGRDDVSPLNAEALKGKSRKLDKCIIHKGEIVAQPEQMASYKDFTFRTEIARRYGIHMVPTKLGFLEPVMGAPKERLYTQYEEEYRNSSIYKELTAAKLPGS